ncbi:Ig-like domain repeat protein [uncultured Methanobrevibacter sp.]|uniref:Ig-like domain repeat protein n=1 Tax=uncultured Methanobrevibacter sp. TaxID=253161 RepID=UPI0026041FC9|nr:Ig-like domain repeat protein [uncultured Methanobrevibacter sp.]
MKFHKQFFLSIILLILIFGISSVNAEDSGSSDSYDSYLDDSSIECTQGNYNFQVNNTLANPSNDVIIVNDWNELKSYCEKTDKNYVLQLKENTNFYPVDGNDSSNQIIVKNNVTILGNNGAYFGDKSNNPHTVYYTPIKTAENSGISLKLFNLTFKWMILSQNEPLESGMFIELAGNSNENTLENCIFDNITSQLSHACVYYIKRGYTSVKNCNFTNINTCFGILSIYDPNAGLSCNTAHMLVENCYFENNYASTEPGCINNCGQLIVKNSTFYKNKAFWWAGAIHTHSGANTTIYNSNFTDNVAGWNGGALYTYSYLQIYNSTFTGNNCTTNNGGGAIGACYYGSNPHIYIENSLFQYNENNCWTIGGESTTGTGRGGAISIMDNGDLDVYNSTFISNSASIGTAICANQAQGYGSPNVRLINNKFFNHTKSGDVLVIDLSNSILELSNNYYENNSIVFSKIKLSEESRIGNTTTLYIQATIKNQKYYDEDILSREGYLVYVDGVYVKTVHDTHFNLTFTDGKEHKVYVRPVVAENGTNVLIVNGVPIEYIYVSVNGNDANNGSKDSPVRTIARAISLNTNGIYILDGTYSEYGLVISSDLKIVGQGNVIIGCVDYTMPIFNITNNATVTFKGLRFTNITNSEIINGLNAKEVEIDNCEFYLNNQNTKSILINVYNLIISNSNFTNNGVFKCIYTNYLAMDNCIFANNVVTERKSSSAIDRGNLIYIALKDQQAIISNTIFENNSVNQGCIALMVDDANYGLTVSRSIFTNNNGLDKGVCLYTNAVGNKYSVTVSSSIFINNSASQGTIAYILKQATFTVENSIFLNNNPTKTTGYMFDVVSGSANLVIDNNWWGNTVDNLTDVPKVARTFNPNIWLFLNASANNNEFTITENALVTVDLAHIVNNKGEITKYDDASKLLLPVINIAVVNGVITSVYDKFTNGVFQIIYTPESVGIGSLTVDLFGIINTVDFNILKGTTNVNIFTGDIKYGEDLVIKITLDDAKATGNVVINIDGKKYTVNLVNGTGTLIIPNLARGSYDIVANYEGDGNYQSASNTASINVLGVNPEMEVNITFNDYGDSIKIDIILPSGAKGNITVDFEGNVKNIVADGKIITVEYNNISFGKHTVKVYYSGDSKYNSYEKNVDFANNKTNSSLIIDASDVKVGGKILVNVVIQPAPGKDEEVIITIGDVVKTIKLNANGKCSVEFYDLPAGNYTIKAVYKGNFVYYGCENSTNITVIPYPDYQWNQDGFDTKNGGKSNYTGNSNGNDIWNYVISGGQINGSIVIDEDGNIYVATTGGIYSFTSNGTLRWKFTNGYGNAISPGLAICRDIIIAPKSGDALHFINKTTGKKLSNANIWQGSSEFSPVVDLNGNIYISSEYQYSDKGYYLVIVPYKMWQTGGAPTMIALGAQPTSAPTVLNNGLVCINTVEGLKIINTTSKTVVGSFANIGGVGRPVADENNVIYTIGKDGKITALNINNVLWTSKLAVCGSTLVLDEDAGSLYTVGKDGNIYKVDIFNNGETSVLYNLGSNSSSMVVDNQGNIYVGSNGGKVIAIDNSGKLLWVFDAKSPINGGISISNDGIIYVHSDKTVYALGIGKFVSTINASIDNIKVGDDLIIDISVPKDATGIVTVIIGNIVKNFTIENGKVLANIKDLSAGEYTANIIYNGYSKYKPSETSVLFNVTKYDSQINISVGNIEIGKDAIVNIEVTPGATGKIVVTINGKSQIIELKNSKATVIINNLTDAEYKINVEYVGDAKYLASKDSYVFSVDKLKSFIIVSVDDINVGDDAVINIIVPNDATGNVTLVINGKTENIIVKNGKGSITISNLNVGDYTVSATYNGDSRYLASKNSTSFNVSKRDSSVLVSVDDVVVGEDVIINVVVSKGATGNVILVIGDKTETVSLIDSKATLVVKNLAEGNYKVQVIYTGDSRYSNSNNSTSFDVSKKISSVLVSVDDIIVGDNAIVNVIVPNDATGSVTITINGKSENIEVKNGKATLVIKDLTSGTYTVEVNYNGDSKYLSSKNSSSFKVSKISNYDIKFNISKVSEGEDAEIIVILPQDATGNITLSINNKPYIAKVENGKAKIIIPNIPAGTHEFIVTYYGDNKYERGTASGVITVDKKVFVLTVDDVIKFYKGSERLIAKLVDSNGKPIANAEIIFTINGATYKRITGNDGTASMAINLVSGTYKVITKYNGTSVDSNIIIKSTINGQNIIKMYQNGTQFYATFVDSNGNLLVKTDVKFNINGVFYTRKTDGNGVAKLSINLRPGNYILTAINPNNNDEKGFNITVKSLIEANDLTKYFQNASKFEATIYNKDGSLAINKEVTFNINGVFYKRTTNDKGVVSLAINLRPGNYVITTIYEGLEVGNKVNVLPTLETRDLSMKFQDGSKFTAKTVNGQGKPLANQNVTFNVNGVFYHRITNDEGIASLNINLIKGEYIITSIWNGYQTGNTIKID